MGPRCNERLGLKEYTSTRAVLADGKQVDLPTYTCHLQWFGTTYRTQVVASEAQLPLLGTTLLAGRDLVISYSRKTVSLD